MKEITICTFYINIPFKEWAKVFDEDEDSEIESSPDNLLTSCSTGPPGTNCIIKNVKNNIPNNVGNISNNLCNLGYSVNNGIKISDKISKYLTFCIFWYVCRLWDVQSEAFRFEKMF